MNNQTKYYNKAKLLSQYLFILFTGFILILASCKKKEAIPAKTDDVYVAGSITIAGKDYPAYWKNGTKVQLSTTEEGYVYALAVNGEGVYAVGYVAPNSDQITLWKNGKAIPVTLPGTPPAEAYGIALSGTNVYVCGYQSDGLNSSEVAKYWKIGADEKPIAFPLGQGGYIGKNAEAYGIAVSANHVYVTGDVNAGKIAVLWDDTGTQYTGYKELTDGTLLAKAWSIALSGPDVYIGGTENESIKYWVNDGKPANTHVLGAGASYEYLNGIAVNGNTVYMAGIDASGLLKKAMYWNNGKLFLLTGGSGSGEKAYSIAVAGNNVYVTGDNDNTSASYLWRNGKLVAPFDGKDANIYAIALFVVKN